MPEARKLAENADKSGFTIYLEGHEGHRGNVLVHSYLKKVERLVLVLNKLERAFISTNVRQTDFEIVGADKRNPTTLSLKPVPRTVAYDPSAALKWGIQQIDAVSRGEEPDERVNSDVAYDLVKLATKENKYGYKVFWLNGHAEAVRFDEDFLANAVRLAKNRMALESPTRWRIGVSQGAIVGKLKKVDDLEVENEFVVVPPVGAAKVVCTFPEHLRDKMGEHLFKVVRVSGKLHYGEESPFPFRVEATDIVSVPTRRKSMIDLRGLFASQERVYSELDALLNGD